jgi:hypothetical protein
MSANQRLERVRLKVGHALDLRRHFESEAAAFLATNPLSIATQRDPDSNRLKYYVHSLQPVPQILALLTGDILHNLRGALDHLAYQLFIIGTKGAQGVGAHIYFPICKDLQTYEGQKGGKTKGIKADALAAIDALKPYKGGNDALWLLHSLNTIDKHRLLMTAGAAMAAVNIGGHFDPWLEGLAEKWPEKASAIRGMPPLDLFVRPADRQFPLKVGDVIYVDAPDATPNPRLQFRIDLALDEIEAQRGASILEVINQTGQAVEAAVTALAPHLDG